MTLAIRAQGIRATFEPATGLLAAFAVTDGGRELAPLHRAPWVGTGESLPADAAPLMASLGGDFLCAPFGQDDEGSGIHGWPANSPWHVIACDGGRLQAVLARPVLGAVVAKELSVEDGHPFVYQRHLFLGGRGRLPVANHANLAVRNGALIRTSAKSHWETPKQPLEADPARGRSRLLSPARAEDPRAFPNAGGGSSDLTRYPWNDRAEDFCVGVEAKGHALGWTAVTRAEGDLFLSLRDPRRLPMTMLWHSNGGRDYAPWSGRHTGCLGIEEGAAGHMLGLSDESALSGPGALALSPEATAEVRHVLGCVAWDAAEAVAEVAEEPGAILVRGERGTTRRLPFRSGFLG